MPPLHQSTCKNSLCPTTPNFCFPILSFSLLILIPISSHHHQTPSAHTTTKPQTSGVHILNLLSKPNLSTRPSPLFPVTSGLLSDLIFPSFLLSTQTGLFHLSPHHTHTPTHTQRPQHTNPTNFLLHLHSPLAHSKHLALKHSFFSICISRGPLFLL